MDEGLNTQHPHLLPGSRLVAMVTVPMFEPVLSLVTYL